MAPPFRIAVITTEYRTNSHADVIVSRWVEPRPTDSLYGWGSPKTQIASMYVDQLPANDLSAEVSRKFQIPRFDTVEAALNLGGDSLAVDAVLLIVEHGVYPSNSWGQKLYPRKELFDQVVAAFRKSGRSVPLFFDKHFSWNPAWIHEMYWTVRDCGIPFFGGSSIPHLPLSAAVDCTGAAAPREIVASYWDSLEAYLFHNLELVRSVTERRAGAEVGPFSVIAWKDAGVWEAMERGDFSARLLEASVRSTSDEAGEDLLRAFRERETPVCAFQFCYGEGPDALKETHFWHPTVGRKFAFACEFKDSGAVVAACAEARGAEHFFANFAILDRKIEDFFLSGISPIPMDRLYLTSMETAAGMQALATPGERLRADWIKLPVPRELALPTLWPAE